MIRKTILTLILLCFALSGLYAAGSNESQNAGKKVRIVGTLAMKGNVPLNKVVLVADDGVEYDVIGPLVEELYTEHRFEQLLIIGNLSESPPRPPVITITRYKIRN